MSLRNEAMRGLLWSAVEKWGGKLFSLVVFLLLARMLGPEAFGLVALAGVFIAFAQVFVQQGLAQAIVQRSDLEPAHLDTAFWISLLLGGGMTICTAVFAGSIAALMKEPVLEPVIRLLSVTFVLSALNGVQTALFQRSLAFKVLAVRTLIANVIGGCVGVGMAFGGFGVWSLVGQQLVGSAVGAVVLWSTSEWRPGLRISRQHFAELFAYGANVVGIGVLEFLNRRSDDLLIGFFLGPTALGYYTVAYRIFRTLTDLLTGISTQVAFPVFSKLQEEPARLLSAYYQAIRATSFIAFPVFLGLAAAAPEVIPTVFGPQWEPSVPVMQVLAFIGLLHAMTFFNASVMMAMGRPSWRLKLGILNSAANVIAFMIVVRWGIVAVAAAYTIRGYLTTPLGLMLIRKLIGLDFTQYVRQIALPFAASLVAAAAVTALRYLAAPITAGFTFMGLEVLVGVLTYGAVLFIAAPSLLKSFIDLLAGLPKQLRLHDASS